MKIYDKLFENVCEEEQNENGEIYCQYMLVIYCRGLLHSFTPFLGTFQGINPYHENSGKTRTKELLGEYFFRDQIAVIFLGNNSHT